MMDKGFLKRLQIQFLAHRFDVLTAFFLCIKRNHRQELSAIERCIGVCSAASGWEYKLNDKKGKYIQVI
jgi:hypothetical protein